MHKEENKLYLVSFILQLSHANVIKFILFAAYCLPVLMLSIEKKKTNKKKHLYSKVFRLVDKMGKIRVPEILLWTRKYKPFNMHYLG